MMPKVPIAEGLTLLGKAVPNCTSSFQAVRTTIVPAWLCVCAPPSLRHAQCRVLGFASYTPEQLTTLQHVVEDMDHMRDTQLADLGPDEVLGEPEPDVVKVGVMCTSICVCQQSESGCSTVDEEKM